MLVGETRGYTTALRKATKMSGSDTTILGVVPPRLIRIIFKQAYPGKFVLVVVRRKR